MSIGLTLGACHSREKPKRVAIPTVAAARQLKAKAVGNAKVEIRIEGMKCAVGYARKIERELGRAKGVAEAKVNFEAKEATVVYDSVQTDAEKLARAIAGAGHYRVEEITEL